MAHKHTGNILICNVCDIEMCFSCASADCETGEWFHKVCLKQSKQIDLEVVRSNQIPDPTHQMWWVGMWDCNEDKTEMLTLLNGLIDKQVNILMSGRYIQGTLTAVNTADQVAHLKTDNDGVWVIAVANIDAVTEL